MSILKWIGSIIAALIAITIIASAGVALTALVYGSGVVIAFIATIILVASVIRSMFKS